MVEVESRVNINREPDEVFGFLAEPANWTLWLEGIVESKQQGRGAIKVGTRVNQVVKFLGRRFDMTAEVIECDWNRRLTMKVISGPFPMSWIHLVVGRDGGSAVITKLEANPGRFFRIAGPLLKPLVQRHFDEDHAALKSILERVPDKLIGGAV